MSESPSERNISYDYVVVSAFGRANWLAYELRRLGHRVLLFDVSACLGARAPEDHEGPFGFFKTPNMTATEVSALAAESAEHEVDAGFTVWTRRGVLEFKGPLYEYAAETHKIPGEVEELIWQAEKAPEAIKTLKSKVKGRSFSQRWLADLSYSLCSNVQAESSDLLSGFAALPLFSPYFMRRMNRQSLKKGREFCQRAGCEVFEAKEDGEKSELVYDAKTRALSILVSGEGSNSRSICGDQWMWFLSSEETEELWPEASQRLYPKGPARPVMSWSRYRVSVEKSFSLNVLPDKVLIIDDLHLPWTHTNLCWIERTVKAVDLDVWVKLPIKRRSEREYLKSVGDDIAQLISQRLGGVEVTVLQGPHQGLLNPKKLKPCVFPVFTEKSLNEFKVVSSPKILWAGAEFHRGLGWYHTLRMQREILENCREKLSRSKGEEVGRTLHAP